MVKVHNNSVQLYISLHAGHWRKALRAILAVCICVAVSLLLRFEIMESASPLSVQKKYFKFTFEMKCNKKLTGKPKIDFSDVSLSKCENTVFFETSHGIFYINKLVL